jgi:hypothetical protein
MANTIVLKRSATPSKVPTTSQLALGEIAINTYDGLIYIKKDNGTASVVQIGGVTSVNGETGAVTIDTGDVAENGNLYFTNTRARSAISAGSGITYNSGTGAISTTQTLTTAGSPTFVNLTLTGGIPSIAGDIIPSADVTYDLGSASKQWKDIYVGPGSLYVNGQKVLQDDSGTITFTADTDENIRIKTLGTGVLQLGSSSTTINVDSTLQIAAGKNITDSAGIKVNFGDSIEMNGNKVIGLGAPSSANDAATKTYVDTAISAISTSAIAQGNSNISVVDSGTGTVTVTVDGSTALTVTADGVVVAGNFTVSGTTTTVNSNTVAVADNILTLNSDATGAPTQNAGIEVERGDDSNTQIRWNEGSDTWTFTNDGAVYYPMATSTDVLAEGSTNLYHTTARARSSVSATSASGISYNSSTGTFSLGSIPNSSLSNSSITINGTSVALGGTRTLDTDAVSEGSTNKYFSNTLARGAISFAAGSGAYNSTTGVFTIPTNTNQLTNGAGFATEAFVTSAVAGKDNTDELTEGSTNLFFTNARARAAVSAGTGISYNSSTGVITNTITQYTDALARGAVSFTAGSGAYNSSTGVITIPTNTNQLTNGAGFATESFVTSAVAGKDNTSEITEGSNLYFTDARARAAVSAGTGISYNSSTGVITNSDLGSSQNIFKNFTDGTTTAAADSNNDTFKFRGSNGVTVAVASDDSTHGDSLLVSLSSVPNSSLANSSITVAGTSVSLGGSVSISTSNVSEGSNLYYTDARARAAITAGTGITVTSGVVATTITQYTDALARASNSFVAGSGAYNSTTGVITIPTNNNQIANGAGYITGYTETDTLASVTARGATTSTALSTGALTVTGAITATGEVTAYFSDLRLKTNIVPIADALEKVEAINGVTFDPNEDALALGIDDRHQMGVIAQEIEAVAPELVCDSAFAGYKTVRYDKLTALLIEAVKELSAKVKTLEAQLGNTKPQL